MAAPSRLSPAANLLRNSKLFALPSAIPLPPSIPSAEPTAGSDTATTIYPTRAAIVTPQASLWRGDWGLKRALPLKSTTHTSTPTVRLTKDIDSAGHVTDFESASDHVQTHAKWQDIHMQIKNKPSWAPKTGRGFDGTQFSVFHPGLDNATVTPEVARTVHDSDAEVPEHLRQSVVQLRSDREAAAQENGQVLPPPQKALVPKALQMKRWRYEGPWLAGMTELEFEAYLDRVGRERISAFEKHLKSRILEAKEKRRAEKLAAAAEVAAGNGDDSASTKELPPIEVTEDDIASELRILRQNPGRFGPEVAEFLDLPDGVANAGFNMTPRHDRQGATWQYKANESASTAASSSYRDVGPPRTHPSAGFSYVRSDRLSHNNPRYGPQIPAYHLPARVLRDRTPREDRKTQGPQAHGVGGFVSRPSYEQLGRSQLNLGDVWAPRKGGTKTVARLNEITVAQDGSIELETSRNINWSLKNTNVPISRQAIIDERSERVAEAAKEARAAKEMPDRTGTLDFLDDLPHQSKQNEEVRDPNQPNETSADILRQLDLTYLRSGK